MFQNGFMKDTEYDVFISYSSKNKNVTDALCHFLEERKIRCWFAPRDIVPGKEYAESIAQAMSKVKVFVLVYSNFSLSSQWVKKETNLAVSKEKIVIPFRIDDCSFEGTAMELYLNDRHWIDAIPDPDKAFGDLADAITALIGTKPSTDIRTGTEPMTGTGTGTMRGHQAPRIKFEKQKATDRIKSEEQEATDRLQAPDGLDSVIDSFLDHADDAVIKRCLAAKNAGRISGVSAIVSFVLFIVFMSSKREDAGFLAFLACLILLLCWLFFTIQASIFFRKLACPFKIKYGALKKAYETRRAKMPVIALFFDHADLAVVSRFLAAKFRERVSWISAIVSFILFIIFISERLEGLGTLAFLVSLVSLPCGIVFTIQAYFYSRKLACPFETKYATVKRAYEMRQNENTAVASFLDHADFGLIGRLLRAKFKERVFWISFAISMVLFVVCMSSTHEILGTLAGLAWLTSLLSGIVFTIQAYFYSRKLACPFEVKYSALKKAYEKRLTDPGFRG